MRKIILGFVVLVSILLTACNNEEPSIEIEANVAPISDLEYNKVGATNDLDNPKQEHFKVLDFKFHINHTNEVKNRNIEMFQDWTNTLIR